MSTLHLRKEELLLPVKLKKLEDFAVRRDFLLKALRSAKYEYDVAKGVMDKLQSTFTAWSRYYNKNHHSEYCKMPTHLQEAKDRLAATKTHMKNIDQKLATVKKQLDVKQLRQEIWAIRFATIAENELDCGVFRSLANQAAKLGE